jgi:hypothetical protein
MEALAADGGQATQSVREEEATLWQARWVFYTARAEVGVVGAPAVVVEPTPGPWVAAAGLAPTQELGATTRRFLGEKWEDPEDQVDVEADAVEAAAAVAPGAPVAPTAAAVAPIEQAATRPHCNATDRPKYLYDRPIRRGWNHNDSFGETN